MSYVQDIKKSAKEVIRVELSEFQGKSYLNIRVWYKVLESDEVYKPTQKGVTLRLDLYQEFKNAILAVESEIDKISKIDSSPNREMPPVPQ